MKSTFLFFSLLIFFPLSAQKYKKLNESGLSAFDQADYNTAIEFFDRSVEKEPDQDEAYYYRGVSYFLLQKYNEAIPDFTKVIEVNPGFQSPYLYRGLCKLNLNETEESINDFNSQLEIQPGNKDALKYRGIAKQRLGMSKEAIDDIDAGANVITNDIEALGSRAICYIQLGRYDEAELDVKKGIAIDSNDYNIILCRAWLNALQLNFPLALWYAGKIRTNVYNRDYYLVMLEVYTGQQDLEKLEITAKEFISNEEHYYPYYILGYVNLMKGNYDASHSNFLKSLELNPKNYYTLYYMTKLNFMTENYIEGSKYSSDLIKYYPDSSYGFLVRGYSLLYLKNESEGYPLLKQAYTIDSTLRENINAYINYLLKTNEFSEARYRALKQIRSEILDTTALKSLAKMLMVFGQFDLVIMTYHRLLESQPSNEMYMEKIAWSYYFMGDMLNARKVVNKLREKNPNNAECEVLFTILTLGNYTNENDVLNILNNLNKRFPENGSVYMMLAQIKKGMGRTDYCDDIKKAILFESSIYFNELVDLCNK